MIKDERILIMRSMEKTMLNYGAKYQKCPYCNNKTPVYPGSLYRSRYSTSCLYCNKSIQMKDGKAVKGTIFIDSKIEKTKEIIQQEKDALCAGLSKDGLSNKRIQKFLEGTEYDDNADQYWKKKNSRKVKKIKNIKNVKIYEADINIRLGLDKYYEDKLFIIANSIEDSEKKLQKLGCSYTISLLEEVKLLK